MTTQKKPIASMTQDELRKYKLDYYNKNKAKVQRERVIKGIQNGKRTPSKKTLDKYNIEVVDGKIVLPPVKQTVEYVESDPTPKIVKIVREHRKPIEVHSTYTGKPLTADILTDFLNTEFTELPKAPGAKTPLVKKVLNHYQGLPERLFKLRNIPYDGSKDLTEWLTDEKSILDWIASNPEWKSNSTKAIQLGEILKLRGVFPPLNAAMSNTVYNSLDKIWKRWRGLATIAQANKTANTILFSFDVIKKQVEKKYKKGYEFLFLSLYTDMIPRDDFGLRMAYKEDDMKNNKHNYMLMDESKGEAHIVMNSYKTVDTYRSNRFKVSPDNYKMIEMLHSKEKKKPKKLFPNVLGFKLGNWAGKFLAQIKPFENEKIDIYYLRHSCISTRLMAIKKDPDFENKAVDIAELSMHEADTQKKYINPLMKLDRSLQFSMDTIEKADKVFIKAVGEYNGLTTRSRAKANK